jgi:elongator complex protein 1
MRNLRNVQRTILQFPDSELPLSATAWESSGNILICAFGPSKDNSAIELYKLKAENGQYGTRQLVASWDAPCPNPDLTHDAIVSLQFFPDSRSYCVILAGGDIVLVREQPLPGEDHIEIVGSVDEGIAAARWSPDEELLAVCTKSFSLLLMSRDFEPLADVKLTAEDMKATKHVSVGWGKAETQFKGKRAKALRDPTVPEKIDEGILSATDDGRVTISWRGDGEYLALNAIESQKHRMIRVYSRDGVLDSVSEPVDNFESALSWRPAGNLIAGVKRDSQKAEILFFERNGLRHGQFSLRVTEQDLLSWASSIALEWNADSTVLAVIFNDRVQLWTMGNYHYYLKQTVWFRDGQTAPPIVTWNSETPLLIAASHAKELHINQYALSINQGSTISPNDSGITGVIDGNTIKLTPFRYANIPPPMSRHDELLDKDIIDLAINCAAGVVVTLHRDTVSVLKYKPKQKITSKPKLVGSIALPAECSCWYQIEVSENGQVAALGYIPGEGEKVYICALGEKSQTFTLITHGFDNSNPSALVTTVDGSEVYTQTYKGRLQVLSSSFEATSSSDILSVHEFCPWMSILTAEDSSIAFGLSRDGSLYANERLIAHNCTSFVVTASHFIFTTSQHLLKFVHITSTEELEVPGDEPETDERCRSIERGAKIVTAVPSTYSLILQMPRGNLETIYPRAMVLAGIRQDIDGKDYKSAFITCRAHRVDMNIVHDHDSESFMKNISLFVEQVSKVEHIDLFLSQLRDEDVSQTMYRDTVRRSTTNGLSNGTVLALHQTSKINRICDAFLEVLEKSPDTRLQNTITAYVCKSPPDLDGGLRIISNLKEQGEEVAEKAAEHICFLADVNRLYDHALGIYDLDVALLVAQNSQKDPREYLPYIQSLQEMAPLQRQFTIDDDLGRRQKALFHLYTMDSFDELESYTEKHGLYSAAVELYKYQPQRLNRLMRLHADFLNNRNRYKDAGIAYEFLGDYAAAIPAYRAANMWRETLSCAALVPLQEHEIKNMAEELIEGLEESKDYQAAAIIYLDYLADIENAVQFLCKAYQFAEALRIIAHRQQPGLLKTAFDPGLTERFTSTTELLSECKGQIKAQTERLRELRVKKEQEPRK